MMVVAVGITSEAVRSLSGTATRSVRGPGVIKSLVVSGDRMLRNRLEDLSPVVRSLAREQFDDLVKRARIFCAPEMVDAISGCTELETIVLDCAG